MSDDKKPTTLEQLDNDLLFVEAEMADARDLGRAVHLMLFNLVIELDKKGIINGKEFCLRFLNPAIDVDAGTKIALDLLASELITQLHNAVADG